MRKRKEKQMDYQDYNPDQHNLFVTFHAPQREICDEPATWGDGEYYYCNAHGTEIEIDHTPDDAAPRAWQCEIITIGQ